MKILIAGGGKVGAALIRHLSVEDYNLTLIDSDQGVLDDIVNRYDVMTIHGNCAAKDILDQARVREADLLIAVTNADEVNLLTCMTAHQLNPNLHTIARIRNPEYTDQVFDMREAFALSLMVNPERQAAIEMERLIKFPGFLKRDSFAKGRVEIVELRIEKASKLCNVPLKDLGSIVKCKVLVCTILRNGASIAPDGNCILQEGDRIFVTAPTNDLTALLKNLGIITHKVGRVMIAGGGRVSFYLAQQLTKSGISVEIIEQDADRCRVLAGLLPKVSIIHGDASNQGLLDSEGISRCDALITATGLDELNMIASLYGHVLGIPQIITKLSHMEGSRMLDGLPLGSIVCPKELCSNSIVRYVRAMDNQTGAAVTVHSIADGQAEAIEFRVDETTRNCEKPLKSIKLKKNVLIVSISRGTRIEIPNGDSMFHRGDTLVVVTNGETVISQLNDIFNG